ncbi:ATPase domain-containing protein [Vreelandella arcis]|uniref:non-specific serine/threonine protein kinase n=1 Tax=Vreelandella arcis TaxID=416873 RepID=A0A1G9YI90_9GAMM|nr:ATPase domain-containing protein [Halomonas arcis]SDN08889.1 circadian clock protein KaiC [Halomonas arcis]
MTHTQDPRSLIGVTGLDQVLHGGLIPRRAYLIRGGPGSGKTTLGMHFLVAERPSESLLVSLGEAEEQLRDNARRSGLPFEDVNVLDVSPGQASDIGSEAYNLLESWDVEGNSIHDRILDHVRAHRPARILIDSLSQMRYLSADTFQFRKQVLSLLRTLTSEGATVMFTSEESADEDDQALPFLSDGVISLEPTEYGRLCRITKFRGSGFEEGTHFYQLGKEGMTLYPRLMPNKFFRTHSHTQISTGLSELDALTHGGIERGTVTLLSGPTGVGKTTLGAQLMSQGAASGERAVIYNFDENASTFFTRCRQIGLPVEDMVDTGNLRFEAVEPLLYHPDQFAASVREEVEEAGTTMVMIDSLSGYQQSMCGENLQARVHALCRYLVNMGVTVVLVNEVFTITGSQARVTEQGLSYVADNIIMLRYIELDGELCKTIGVLKKRTGSFEKALREFDINQDGLQVGRALHGMRGLMSGVPEMIQPNHRRDMS